jgi:hypothetical protein
VSSRISRRSSQLALTPADESAVSRAEPAWQAAIQEILREVVTLDELKALSLALAALRSDLERRRLGSRPDEASPQRPKSWPQLPVRLLPFRPHCGRVWSQVRDVAMLSERLAGAREVAALLQARVEGTQQRAADPAHFLDPSAGLIVRPI